MLWEQIWYYNPRQPFPQPKMLKCRFLGIAPNIGDAFCNLILTSPDDATETRPPQVLARSVIRRRYHAMARPRFSPSCPQQRCCSIATTNTRHLLIRVRPITVQWMWIVRLSTSWKVQLQNCARYFPFRLVVNVPNFRTRSKTVSLKFMVRH